jgi:hypothetical protein
MRSSLRHRIIALALLASFVPAPAFAQSDSDKATARQLGQVGQDALDAKDYKKAEDSFRRADGLFHAPTLMLGLARAQAAQGRYVESWESYHRVVMDNVTSPPIFAKALDDAKKEIQTVENRRSRVTINVTGADAPKVTLDEAPVKAEALGIERFVDPGQHSVKVTADGYKLQTRPFKVDEGKAEIVSIAMEKDTGGAAVVPPTGPTPPGTTTAPDNQGAPPTQPTTADVSTSGGSMNKTVGFVALGVGAAGLIVGGITGLLALGKHGDLSNACQNGNCTADKQSDVDSYHTMGTISTVGFIVGGVGIAGGIVLLLTAPKAQAAPTPLGRPRVSPYIGLGSIGAQGTF